MENFSGDFLLPFPIRECVRRVEGCIVFAKKFDILSTLVGRNVHSFEG